MKAIYQSCIILENFPSFEKKKIASIQPLIQKDIRLIVALVPAGDFRYFFGIKSKVKTFCQSISVVHISSDIQHVHPRRPDPYCFMRVRCSKESTGLISINQSCPSGKGDIQAAGSRADKIQNWLSLRIRRLGQKQRSSRLWWMPNSFCL